MVECIAQLEHGSVDNPRLEQLTEELAERLLTVKGRKVYGYLPPRVKAIVDAIVEELAKDERVSAAYETWQTLYEQVCLDYDQRPPKRLPLSRQKEFRSVRNMVIRETLQWIAERQRCGEHLPRRKDLSSKRMPQKPRQRTLRSRHLSRRRSPNLTGRRVPHQKIPPPLMLPLLMAPRRLRLKMHRLFLSSQFTLISKKRAHRQERITMPPRWAKPLCGCCIT